MNNKAISAFRALAHEIRLSVFRLLIKQGPAGLPAGQIALKLKVPASTLSTHLNRLEQANLLHSWREQQKILYAINQKGTRELAQYLLNDCCGGNPALCGYSIEERPAKSRKSICR